jgi:hypothetical protein
MTMGAFLFMPGTLVFRKNSLAQTARHCAIPAFFGAVPTVLFGLMDWQHFYGGSLLFPIKMKHAPAGISIVFLILAIIFLILAIFFLDF